MDLQERITQFVRSLPVAHRVVIGVAAAGLLMATFVFFNWVSTPTYTVLYAGMDERDVSAVITQLESDGVPYKLDNGGRTVMVPKAQLFDTRARLAGQGIGGSVAPQGYEILDAEGLTISDFRQQVDFKRAVEGELARTLMSMDAVGSATVHLVIPEDELFVEAQEPASASVLVDTARTLNQNEIETITFLVSSAVADLEPSHVTVADTNGNVLNAPGDSLGVAGALNKNLRLTREYEAKVAADLQRLLNTAVGVGRAEVSVQAVLDFDETETQRETYAPESQVATREQTVSESFEGSGTPPGGTVGIDGGPIASGANGETTTYNRDEVTREYGVDKTIDVTKNAPGDVQQLSVAIVLDDGSLSGLAAPDTNEIERLITAAAGISEPRGDTVAVTTAAFPVIEDPTELGGNLSSMLDMVPQILKIGRAHV